MPYTIEKRFRFRARRRLMDPSAGTWRTDEVTYRVRVRITSERVDAHGNVPGSDVVRDFFLWVKRNMAGTKILCMDDPMATSLTDDQAAKCFTVGFIPTAANMAHFFFRALIRRIPGGVLESVSVSEGTDGYVRFTVPASSGLRRTHAPLTEEDIRRFTEAARSVPFVGAPERPITVETSPMVLIRPEDVEVPKFEVEAK
jgi:6-pyruvoyl-tetrahydropterin synthase